MAGNATRRGSGRRSLEVRLTFLGFPPVVAVFAGLILTAGCVNGAPGSEAETGAADVSTPAPEDSGTDAARPDDARADPPMENDAAALRSRDTAHADLRQHMVERQIEDRGVEDPTVLGAMRTVPRHRFVPEASPEAAYGDSPYPIGHGQTISQPYIVAFMAQAADISAGDRVLEIGTGSGYGAAVLAELASEVYTIEILPELARRARDVLDALGYENVHVRTGNGWLGWPEEAPFDAVVVTAAPDEVPEALVEQLAVGGTLVIPVGDVRQTLRIIERTEDGLEDEDALPVRFVPMVEEPGDGAG